MQYLQQQCGSAVVYQLAIEPRIKMARSTVLWLGVLLLLATVALADHGE